MRRSKERISLAVITLLAVALLATPALARDGDDGPFGLGISAGEPTGLTVKYFTDENMAIEAAAGWAFYEETGLHLHLDALWHIDDQPGVEDNAWKMLVGFGFRYLFGEDDEFAGVRIPLGFTYAIGETPMDAFFEIVPVINFGAAHDFEMNVAAGVHYFF